MSSEKPANMWQQSRTRLLGVVTERERESAERRQRAAAAKLKQVMHDAKMYDAKQPKPVKRWQCTARRFDPHYMPGYVCVHGVDHDGAHRDKHDVEWSDEDLQS